MTRPLRVLIACETSGIARRAFVARGLPQLTETNRLPEPERGSDEWRRWNRVHRMPPGPERARLRSRSFPGMMAAAADQWGGFAMKEEQAA